MLGLIRRLRRWLDLPGEVARLRREVERIRPDLEVVRGAVRSLDEAHGRATWCGGRALRDGDL